MVGGDLFFGVWIAFRCLFIVLLAFFIISGIDDFFFDIVFYVRTVFRALFRRKVIEPVTRQKLDSVQEKPIVVIVPAWHEAAVIGQMLRNTLASLDYRNYYIFVGTYPNDEATRLEVEKVREIYPNVEVAITPSDGPTNKADCLNWIYQGILIFELEHGIRFEVFVMHDAEDVVHPLSLKYFNYLMPRFDFVQLPVYPIEQKWTNLVTGVYMDEFAEGHTKDLRSREILSSSIPSAGVGTALSRATIEYLAKMNGNQIFDITSLTEDYLMGIKLLDFSGRKIFLQQGVERVREGQRAQEPIATRGMFPETFSGAVRQKARWILGISLQGWSAGWGSTLGARYCLYRDRKGVLTNILVVVGYVVFLFWSLSALVNSAYGRTMLPPLVDRGEGYYGAMIFVLFLLAWRVSNRIGCTWHVYGFAHTVLVIPRMIVGNFINFSATIEAIRRFRRARAAGVVPEWSKTEHSFPSEDQLRRYHRRLGDLLLDRRWVTSEELQRALQQQKQAGGRLGDILVKTGVLWEEDITVALAMQERLETVEIDPYETPRELLALVPRATAEQHRIYPIGLRGDALVLGTCETPDAARQKAIAEALGRPVRFLHASEADIAFAIRRAYDPAWAPRPLGERLGQRLVQKKKIDEKTLRKALRVQKQTNRRLGEILLEMKALTRADLDKEIGE